MSENPSYYAIIPATVRYAEGLTANAKLLYGEITALSNKLGFCYASNSYFAALYEVNVGAVSGWVKQLRDGGFIRVEIDTAKGNERRIFLTEAPPITKNRNSYDQKTLEGYDDFSSHNNTRKKKASPSGDAMSPNDFLDLWNQYAPTPCGLLTGKRLTAAKARLSEKYFKTHLCEALRRMKASAFLRGENDRGWIANIDWFLRPGTIAKITEGVYDDRKAKKERTALTRQDYEKEEEELKREAEGRT